MNKLEIISYSEVERQLKAAKSGAPFLGLAPGLEPVTVDTEGHVLIAMPAGQGASSTIRAILAPELHRGAFAVILDPKRVSHKWAQGLPNVRYAGSPEEIHQALLDVGDELEARLEEDSSWILSRVYAVAEDLGVITARRGPESDQIRSVLHRVLTTGRAGKVSLLVASMPFGVSYLPNGLAQVGTRILAGIPDLAWQTLAHGWPRPTPKRDPRGLVHVVTHSGVTDTQVAYLTSENARDLATSGIVAGIPSLLPMAGPE